VPTAYLSDPLFLEHDTGPGHAERPARLTAVHRALEGSGLLSDALRLAPQAASAEDLLRVHPAAHVARLREACARAPAALDEDTPVSARSYEVALQAAGGVLAACDAVVAGRARNAFCAIRPPGHHAEPARPMGFCLLNNIAVAARYLQERHGVGKILIVDWDVHHGNGTQAVFWEDPSVLFASSHQWPLYPGTGAREERGEGRGRGSTLNLPRAAGAGDREVLEAYRRELLPAARAFRPEFVLVSAGFDAHREDPLAQLEMTEDGFAELTREVRALAEDVCGGRLVSLLEGGYDLEALGASVVAHVRELTSGDRPGAPA
jgi:acetoin utilization deacetylase AcuC-like enzyme